MLVALVALALLLLAMIAVLRPVAAPDEEPDEEGPDAEALGEKKEQKERELETIRDLDMDFATQKLSEDDYRRLRSRHMAEAGRLILELESREPAPESPPGADSAIVAADAPLRVPEPAVKQGSASNGPAGPSCPACGMRHYAGDRFCRLCGSELT